MEKSFPAHYTNFFAVSLVSRNSSNIPTSHLEQLKMSPLIALCLSLLKDKISLVEISY